MIPLTSALTGFEAFKAFLSTLVPKDEGDRELWLKFGHDRFFVGHWDESGRFALDETELPTIGRDEKGKPIKGESRLRRKVKHFADAFDQLDRLSRDKDGGVFFIPTQPIGFPMAECVSNTDDIGIEIDGISNEAQWQKYQQFMQVTGLQFSSLLTSGGKSIHAHLKADRHLPLDQAVYLRRLAVVAFLSDPVTVNLHQPMRIPGFWRREKESYQSLLHHSHDRYSYDRLVEGFRLWFQHQGWAFPEALPDDWWQNYLRPIFPGHKNRGEAEKSEMVQAALAAGLEGYRAQIERERQEREAKRQQRQQLGYLGESNLVELVAQACDRLGSGAFNLHDHDWKFSNANHARGCCPWHQSSSGNSAWIAPKKKGASGWGFACYACTDNRQIDSFTYWWYSKRGMGATYPTGKQYVEAAIEFLDWAGVPVPDAVRNWQPPMLAVVPDPMPSNVRSAKPSGFGQSEAEEKEDALAKAIADRLRLIQKRLTVFKSQFWESLKRDFLLTEAEGRLIDYYQGYCPRFNLAVPTLLVTGWLGAGKTEAALRSIVQRRDYLSKQILWTIPRTGLGRQTAERAAKLGFPEIRYVQDANSENRAKLRRGEPGLYILCPDSLKEYAVGEVSWADTIVIIDEFAGQRGEILTKSGIMPQFERLLSEAWRVVAVDAFLSDADARIISRYRKGQRQIIAQEFEQSKKKIYWVEQLTKDGLISMRQDGAVFALIDQFAREGVKSVVVSTDNLTALKAVRKRMKAHGMEMHVCSSETVEENAQFMPNPDTYQTEHSIDHCGYTPTAQSGLDMQKHYDRGLLICSGVLPPLQLLQLMGRARQCHEWYVFCPRFTQDSPLSIKALDGDRMKTWGDKLKAAFDLEGINYSERSQGWAQWQSAVDEVSRAFNAEYLYCLLEHFFEKVETITIKDAPVKEWQEAMDEVTRGDSERLIRADLERGIALLEAQKAPQTNAEVWDCRLAALYQKYPEVVDALLQRRDDPATDWEALIALVRLFRSSRLDKLKFWMLAQEQCDEDDAALMAMLKNKFTCAKSSKFKAFRQILLFRQLKLDDLAKCKTKKPPIALDTSHFHAQSDTVKRLYESFKAFGQLPQLFPQVEDLQTFWAVVRQAMSYFGYQSCATLVRVKSEELHPNGYYRNGRRRYSQSRVIYVNAWLQMDCSGNLLFQELFESDILPAIRHRLYLEREKRAAAKLSASDPPDDTIAA